MVDVIIVANGTSTRMGFDKLSANLGSFSVLEKTINAFTNIDLVKNIIVVTDKNIDRQDIILTKGGATRTESVKNGLKLVTSDYCLIHDGARPFVTSTLINNIIEETIKHNSAIPTIKQIDSLVMVTDSLIKSQNREDYFSIQTPQGFLTTSIKTAYELSNNKIYTDDSAVYQEFIGNLNLINGDINNRKITNPIDLLNTNARIGSGYDVHQFVSDKPLVLGGVTIPYEKGMLAHSDGDVVVHALMDSLLNLINERDIGVLFPDTDNSYKNINSLILLNKVYDLVKNSNIEIISISITIMAQAPKLSNFIPLMKETLSKALNLQISQISINATTTENLGIIGEKKGIACLCLISGI